MSNGNFLFTSESVTEGHPDKISDQVSDAILDAILAKDRRARVACETMTSTGLVFVTGEITTDAHKTMAEVPQLVRDTLKEIGYTRGAYGIDAATCSVTSALNKQSPDINQGVDKSETEIGAGDQGLMFGYATDETPELMPLPIQLAHRLARRLAAVRKNGKLGYLRPDGKSQVSVEYKDGKAVRAAAIVLAAQHDDDTPTENIRADLMAHVIEPVVAEYIAATEIPDSFLDTATNYFINHTGRFVRGGPFADAGLTGRKIIVDTYGGAAPHGGGAFSGKDPTKVDRSAAYGARWAAKNVVAAGLAKKCQIQLAYSIGHHQPVSVNVETFSTGAIPDDAIERAIRETFDFSPSGLIRDLNLIRPIYRQVAAYGHFGRADLDLPWEATTRVDALKKYAKA